MRVNSDDAARSFTSSARREQIVEAATAVIAEVGLAKASFSRVARRAGVASTRMISYHFADRDDLVRAVVSAVFADAATSIEPYLPVGGSPGEQLRGLVEGNIRWYAAHRRQVAALLEVWHTHRDADGHLVYGLGSHDLEIQVVGQILDAGQATGEFRPHDGRVTAILVRQALNGVAELLVADAEADVEMLIDEVATTLLRAVAR